MAVKAQVSYIDNSHERLILYVILGEIQVSTIRGRPHSGIRLANEMCVESDEQGAIHNNSQIIQGRSVDSRISPHQLRDQGDSP